MMDDERVLRRWMGNEMRRINDGVVSGRVRLSDLLGMERPAAVTRGGNEYRFNVGVVRKIGTVLPGHLHKTLRLPVIFYFDMEVSGSCMLSDPAALAAFQEMGELSRERQMEGGALWVGRAIVYGLMRKYPTIIQMMMR